ncbi:hypothetical protein D0Z00_001145 [Geotrichum galactomycetum]|uniref:Uncharacterized protein n=1 Tax=Geotrichum galactomycetum TaxID=27317 RepID=A0ACB6V7W1_9ASCO|nr:hypothetical protein D0Z00_001145 [Geotrichum candidum]
MEISISRGVTNEGVPFYTCNTCGLSFPTADLQRLHMKTDWHRYNLKRRVASLPPISSEVFAEKILQQQAQEAEQAAAQHNGGRAKRGTGVRQVTKKDKKREERLQRRLVSNQAAEDAAEKKRAAGIVRPASPSGDSVVSSSFSLGDPVGSDGSSISDIHSEIDSQSEANFTELDSETASRADDASTIGGTDNEDEIDRELKRRLARNRAIPPNCCFITDKESETVEANAEHMWKSYGLFIPEKNFLTDLTGLMTYLGEKVGLGNMCLYCGFEGRSLESIRAHMLAKSHVKIPYESIEDKLEISEYYDFSTSYKSRPRRKAAASAAAEDEEDEWEDEDEDGNVIEKEASEDQEEDEDDYYQDEAYIDSTGMELAIGNLRVGHRSMARYYRQKFRPENEREGQGTVLAVSNNRPSGGLVRARNMVEERAQKRAWKDIKKADNIQRRREGKNINNQKHYRDELLQ